MTRENPFTLVLRDVQPGQMWLPSLLFEMRAAFDETTALQFARQYGGRRLRVPYEATVDHYIAQTFHHPLLEWLVARHRGQLIAVPMATASYERQRNAEIDYWLAAGADTDTIVRRFGVHERTVKRRRKRIRERAVRIDPLADLPLFQTLLEDDVIEEAPGDVEIGDAFADMAVNDDGAGVAPSME